MRRTRKGSGNFKRKLCSWVGTLLIVAGVSLALYPFAQDMYDKHIITARAKETLDSIKDDTQLILPEQTVEEFPEKLIPKEAVLEIPILDLLVDINYGIEEKDFKHIPSFYPQSGYPDTGNVSIAGHRSASNFLHLNKLVEGDEIRLYYGGRMYIYYVDDVFITHGRDWSVIDPTETAALTLTTCDPPNAAPAQNRLIVRAYLSDSILFN